MTPWTVGQQVVVNRERIATIERITSAGLACIGARVFDLEGNQWGVDLNQKWTLSPNKIEALTPEIVDILKSTDRSMWVRAQFNDANNKLQRWALTRRFSYKKKVPSSKAMDEMEQVTDAINAVLSQVTP